MGRIQRLKVYKIVEFDESMGQSIVTLHFVQTTLVTAQWLFIYANGNQSRALPGGEVYETVY